MSRQSKFIFKNILNLTIWMSFFLLCAPYMRQGMQWYLVRQFLTMIFIVLGVTVEMKTGILDLSFIAEIGAATCIGAAAISGDLSLWISLGLMILFHVFAGAVRGYLIAKLNVNAIVITLALQIILSSISGIFTNEKVIFLDTRVIYAGVSFWRIILCLLIMLTAFLAFVLKKTYYGRYIQMLGECSEAVEESGLNYTAIRMIICIASSLCFAFGSVIFMFLTSSGSIMNGNHYLYPALAAVCLGGINFLNGRGSLVGAYVGTWSMVLFLYMMVAWGIQRGYETILEGALISVSIVINVVSSKN